VLTADDGMRVGTTEQPAAPSAPEATGQWPALDGRPSQRFTAWLLGITAGGLVLRIVFTVVARGHQPLGRLTDNRWYYRAGRMLAEGDGFANPFIWEQHHRYVPSAGHPPLYSVFLGGVSALGLGTPLGDRLATCVLGAIAVLAIGLTARELAGDRAGLIAAVLAAIYPNLWINDAALVSETPFVLLTTLFLWAAIRCWRRPTFGRVAWVSLWIGLASLTRSEAVLLYPLAVLPLVLRLPDLSIRERVQRIGIAALVAAIVLGPWVVYSNIGRFKHHVLIVSGSGVAMSYGNCDRTYSGQFLGYWYWNCGVSRLPKNQDETVLDAQGRNQALHYIRTHLDEQPKVIAARVGRLFHVYRPRQSISFDTFFERRGLWPSRLALAMYYPVTLLAIAGAVVLWRRKLPISPFVAVTISVVIAAAVTFGVTRYRSGFDAAAVVLAAVTIDAGLRRGALVRTRRTTSRPTTAQPEPSS
jgi:4-amino-4-deoxy-L-arabinose transferase-like glycosyltransferase